MGDRIVDEGKDHEWYAFVPLGPEIFGHLIVTIPGPPCIRDIVMMESAHSKQWRNLNEGVRVCAEKLSKILNVDRVYTAFLGESAEVHVHCHLVPRYGFLNQGEIEAWSKLYGVSEGDTEWRRFYSNPTSGFSSLQGFRYLGEVERTFNEIKECLGHPSFDILSQIAEKIKGIS